MIKFRLLTQTSLWMEPFMINHRVQDASAVTWGWCWMHTPDTRIQPSVSDCSKLVQACRWAQGWAAACLGSWWSPQHGEVTPWPLFSFTNCPQGVRVNQDFISLPSSLRYFSKPHRTRAVWVVGGRSLSMVSWVCVAIFPGDPKLESSCVAE